MRKKRMKLEGPGEKEREGENTYYMFFKEDCEYLWIGKHRENIMYVDEVQKVRERGK